MAPPKNSFGQRPPARLEPMNRRVGLAQMAAIGLVVIFAIAVVLYAMTGVGDNERSQTISPPGGSGNPPTTSGQGR